MSRLREHAADGRLDVAELEQRIDAAYAARTRGDWSCSIARPMRVAK